MVTIAVVIEHLDLESRSREDVNPLSKDGGGHSENTFSISLAKISAIIVKSNVFDGVWISPRHVKKNLTVQEY